MPSKDPDKRAAQRVSRLVQMHADPEHPNHGRPSGYIDGCRCASCKTAMQEKRTGEAGYAQSYRTRTKLRLLNDPNDHLHGTVTGYNCGCRCPQCKSAVSAYMKAWKAKSRYRSSPK